MLCENGFDMDYWKEFMQATRNITSKFAKLNNYFPDNIRLEKIIIFLHSKHFPHSKAEWNIKKITSSPVWNENF